MEELVKQDDRSTKEQYHPVSETKIEPKKKLPEEKRPKVLVQATDWRPLSQNTPSSQVCPKALNRQSVRASWKYQGSRSFEALVFPNSPDKFQSEIAREMHISSHLAWPVKEDDIYDIDLLGRRNPLSPFMSLNAIGSTPDNSIKLHTAVSSIFSPFKRHNINTAPELSDAPQPPTSKDIGTASIPRQPALSTSQQRPEAWTSSLSSTTARTMRCQPTRQKANNSRRKSRHTSIDDLQDLTNCPLKLPQGHPSVKLTKLNPASTPNLAYGNACNTLGDMNMAPAQKSSPDSGWPQASAKLDMSRRSGKLEKKQSDQQDKPSATEHSTVSKDIDTLDSIENCKIYTHNLQKKRIDSNYLKGVSIALFQEAEFMSQGVLPEGYCENGPENHIRIWSRQKLRVLKSERQCIVAETMLNKQKVIILNIHMANNEQARKKQIETLVQDLKHIQQATSNSNIIIGGDFNCSRECLDFEGLRIVGESNKTLRKSNDREWTNELDYFLVSDYIEATVAWTESFSDHKRGELKVDGLRRRKGIAFPTV